MNYDEIKRQVSVLEKQNHFHAAYQLLKSFQAGRSNLSADAQRFVNSGLLRLSPVWWTNLQHEGLTLRRCRESDELLFRRCFDDPQFRSQFNRQRAWKGDFKTAIVNAGIAPPIHSGLLMWVIELKSRGGIGIASLSSIDMQNRRAEFSIGIPGKIPSIIGAKAILMALHFSFFMANFNKLYSLIYVDNEKALQNAVRLGAAHEGTMADHFHFPDVGFMSVHYVGLTKNQLQQNIQLKAFARDLIGQNWG